MIVSDSEEARLLAAKTIRSGNILAFRTDTFYGLGVDPLNQTALRTLRELKGREEQKPILLLISDQEIIDEFLGRHPPLFDEIARKHWPGPLTLIGPARSELPLELTSGTGTIGIRLPADRSLRSLLRDCGGALTATSANPSGSAPARTAKDVEGYFPNGVSLIVDSGDAAIAEPSTVLDLSGEKPRLVREGVIRRAALGDVLID